jgi:oxygen-independent coproporphyrinogen-3 oxidase
MLGLRLTRGLDLAAEARDLGIEGFTRAREREIAKMCEKGRLARDGDRIWIPRAAWIWTDDTAARLF